MGYRLIRPVPVSELAAAVGLAAAGPKAFATEVGPITAVRAGTFSFAKSWDGIGDKRGAVLVGPTGGAPDGFTVLQSPHPRLDFIRALMWLETQQLIERTVVAPRVHPDAVVGQNVAMHGDISVGAGTVIEPNVTILGAVTIGERCLLRAGCVIGSDGFGFERDDRGGVVRFPHLGGVRIGNRVEIGSCTCVARGTLGDTVIEDDAKVDNLVHVAHNVVIGAGAFVIAGAELSGGVRVGARAWIGPNACTLQKVEVGEGATVGLGAVVTKGVPPGTVVAGNPAEPMIVLKKMRAALNRLIGNE